MRFKWDRKYLYWGLTAFAVILGIIVIYLLLTNLSGIAEGISYVLGAFKAVIYGFALAYILHPLLRVLELPVFTRWGKKLYKNRPHKVRSFSRAMGITLTMLVVVAVLTLLMRMVLPKVYESVITLVGNLPQYYTTARAWLAGLFSDGSEIQNSVLSLFDNLNTTITDFFSADSINQLRDVISQVFTSIYTVARELVNIIIGFVVSVYVMMNKERFAAQAKKFLYAHLRADWVTGFLKKLHDANHIFIGFLGGKIIDSLVIGISSYILLTIFRIPYKELVSVLVGVTNMIPFFGPFIGAVPSALFILMIDPIKCITFLIIIIVLQQLDGNILQPKILGAITGLSGFWVLVALVVGGYFFGVVGMLLSVPVMSMVYAWIKTNAEQRLKKKGLPPDTLSYQNVDYLDPETGAPVVLPHKAPKVETDVEQSILEAAHLTQEEPEDLSSDPDAQNGRDPEEDPAGHA